MNKILAYAGYIILFINFFCYVKSSTKNYGRAFSFFTIYLVGIFIINIFSEILIYFKFQNLFLSHFYFIFQLTILSSFYKVLLLNSKHKQIINFLVICCIIPLAFQYVLNPNLIFSFNLLEIVITSMSLIIIISFHLYNMLTSKKEFFLVSVGLIIYLFSSTFLFLLMHFNVLIQSPLLNMIYPINSILIIIYQLFIFAEWKINYSKSIS